MELHRTLGAVDGSLGRGGLCECGPVARVVALLDVLGGPPGQRPGGLEVHTHLREVVLDGLELADRLTPRVPVVDERAGLLDSCCGQPEPVSGNADPAVVEEVGHHRKALALVADQILRRDPAVVEHDVALLGGAEGHLLGDVLGVVPRRVGGDDEHRVVLVPAVTAAGLRVQRQPVGLDRVADPVLLAVEDPLVAVLLGGGGHPREVASGVRLGDRQPRDLLVVGDGPDVLILLLLGAVLADDFGAETRQLECERNPGVGPVELLGQRQHLGQVQPTATVLLRDVLCDEIRLHPRLEHLPRVLPGLVLLLGDRLDDLLGKLPCLALDRERVFRHDGLV